MGQFFKRIMIQVLVMGINIGLFYENVSYCILKEHLEHFPGGYHVADVAENDEDMEDGMYVRNLLETVQYGSSDICDTFCYNP